MTGFFRQQPMQHGAEGRDPSAGSNEDRVTHRWTQNEVAERPLAADLVPSSHVANKVGHVAILHAVQAKGEASILPATFFRWRRGNGISASDLFAIRFGVF